MSEQSIPDTILVFVGPPQVDLSDLEVRDRPGFPQIPDLEPVRLTQLQGQINIFLQQLNVLMDGTPKDVGPFRLDEFEVSAGFVFEGKGEIKLALLANAELGGSVNAGMKFTFRRSQT